MLCYKEVHKYNGKYYSRYDNGYEFVIGENVPSGNDYIYATDTIENVLNYAYVPYDTAILEMEIPEGVEWHKNKCVITSKKVIVLREVQYEKVNKCRNEVAKDGNPELFSLLQERKESLLRRLQQ